MTEYKPTRGDRKKFLRDLKPGHTYWSIEEADTPLKGMRYAMPWVFKKSALWGGVCGSESAEGVLSKYGPLYDSKPRDIPDLFDDREHDFPEELDAPMKREHKRMLDGLRRRYQKAGAGR